MAESSICGMSLGITKFQNQLNFNSFLNRLKLIENQWENILKIYLCACFKPVSFRFCLFSFFQNTFKIVIKNSLK